MFNQLFFLKKINIFLGKQIGLQNLKIEYKICNIFKCCRIKTLGQCLSTLQKKKLWKTSKYLIDKFENISLAFLPLRYQFEVFPLVRIHTKPFFLNIMCVISQIMLESTALKQ